MAESIQAALLMARGLNQHARDLLRAQDGDQPRARLPCQHCGDPDPEPIDRWVSRERFGMWNGFWVVVARCCGAEVTS